MLVKAATDVFSISAMINQQPCHILSAWWPWLPSPVGCRGGLFVQLRILPDRQHVWRSAWPSYIPPCCDHSSRFSSISVFPWLGTVDSHIPPVPVMKAFWFFHWASGSLARNNFDISHMLLEGFTLEHIVNQALSMSRSHDTENSSILSPYVFLVPQPCPSCISAYPALDLPTWQFQYPRGFLR